MANPLTCLHRIIGPAFNKTTEQFYIFCLSCGTPLNGRHLKDRLFEYDNETNVWVYVKLKENHEPRNH